MDLIADNLPTYLSGFRVTLQLAALSGAIALVAGTLLAAMRVAPIAPLRGLALVYVELVRNTPLTLVFFFLVFVAPQFGVLPPLGFWTAVLALSAYTSAFVCEAVRSGINAVPIGQAEAARAIGLTFGQTLSLVVLPQAVRSVIPPIINVLIALTKNTSVAAGFAVVELLASGRRIALANPDATLWALTGIALFYLVITVPAGYLAGVLERKVAFTR